jgi:DNA-directed RNA polymerase I, II, and III subunit RPABC5
VVEAPTQAWDRADFSDALDKLQLKRYCCRRMVLTHVDLIEKLLLYNR